MAKINEKHVSFTTSQSPTLMTAVFYISTSNRKYHPQWLELFQHNIEYIFNILPVLLVLVLQCSAMNATATLSSAEMRWIPNTTWPQHADPSASSDMNEIVSIFIIYLFTYLFTYLFIYLFIYPSIYLLVY